MKKAITSFDIDVFEKKLRDIFWRKLKEKMPVEVIDERRTEKPEEIEKYRRKRDKAIKARIGYDPSDKAAALRQYRQGKATTVGIQLPPVLFPQDSKVSHAVLYLKVSAKAFMADTNQLQHLLVDKTRLSSKTE